LGLAVEQQAVDCEQQQQREAGEQQEREAGFLQACVQAESADRSEPAEAGCED